MNALTPSTNCIYLKPKEPSAQTKGLALVAPDGDVGMIGAHVGALIFLGALEVRLMLMPGEERTMKCALVVDPENLGQVKELQRVLDAL
jgi:hypothetical protein